MPLLELSVIDLPTIISPLISLNTTVTVVRLLPLASKEVGTATTLERSGSIAGGGGITGVKVIDGVLSSLIRDSATATTVNDPTVEERIPNLTTPLALLM